MPPAVETPAVEPTAEQTPAAEPPVETPVEKPVEKPVETPPATPPVESEGEEIIVYVTETGSKYHRDGCRHLSESKISTSLSRAVKNYGPCGTCKPPVA